MTEWFEDWFNTEEYINVYRHRNDADAKNLVDLIINKTPLPQNAKILDMACGAGRHSILFAQKGYDVTAVDLSENLLNAAKKAAQELKLKINFVRADLRNFNIKMKFDLSVNLFTSFGYFKTDEENFSILKTAYNHLKDDGFFVLDFLNRGYIENNLVKKSIDIINGGYIVQERKIKGERIIKTILIQKNESRRNFYESVRMFNNNELEKAMKRIGFEIKSIYGDFDGNEFDYKTSHRIIIIAKK